MSDPKSYAEFVLGLLDAQLVDCASYYPKLAKEFDRDSSRLSSALKSHGIRFALDTMPAYRKHFDQCLAKRRLTPSHLIHFGTGGKEGTIPRLFRGLILRVFESNGVLKHDPDIVAVRLIRQLLGAVRKLEMQSSVKDSGDTVRDFFKVDMEVQCGDLKWSDFARFSPEDAARLSYTDNRSAHLELERHGQGNLFTTPEASHRWGVLDTIQRVADLISAHLGVFDPSDWRLRHGPGAVADERFGSYKYDFKHWSDKLDSYFPWSEFAVANYDQIGKESIAEAASRGFYHEPPSRLCAVPKTLKAPRLIAAEPTSNQWCQQAIKSYFYRRVEETFVGSFISFKKQGLNGQLALTASHDAKHATIDLSSASDRISCWHVERLFRRLPCLLGSLQATRSVWIKQDLCRYSPRYHYLRKFSTMGNATTFPVQSLFFLTIALGCVAYARKLKVTERSFRDLGKAQVRVFGDDIIVPEDCSGLVVEMLEYLSLKVNLNKTFLEGNFRESCGVDAFRGHDVTTVNVLKVPQRASPGSIVSSVDVHHNLLSGGYAATAHYIQKTAARSVGNSIRFVAHGSGLFGWSDLCGVLPTKTKFRWNKTLMRTEVRCLRPRVKTVRVLPEEPAGLLQFFTEASQVVTNSFSSIGHLGRRPQTKVGLGWVPEG